MTRDKSLVEVLKPVAEMLQRPIDTACNLLDSLLGEPFRIAGSALSDQVAYWQWTNRVTILEKFERRRKSCQLSCQVLPPEFLLPFIRECGDTSDDGLQEAWAALLAAALQDDTNQYVGFIHILKELAPIDARVIKELIENELNLENGQVDLNGRVETIASRLKVQPSKVWLSTNNLVRLAILTSTGVKLTGFGKFFLRACLCDGQVLDRYLDRENQIAPVLLIG